VQRHGIGRQVQRSSSGSTPHDRVTIPQICLSRSLVLDQPRQSALRYPALVSNRPTIRSVPRHPPLIHHWLQRRPTSWIGPKPITQFTRDTQIPIAHAALSSCPPAVSSLGGLRTPAPVRAAPPSWGQHPKTFTRADMALVRPSAGSLTAAKSTSVILAQHYKRSGCNPGKCPDTRRMVFASWTGRRGIVHDTYLCIAVWRSEPPRR
jgi:hypothetical protein